MNTLYTDTVPGGWNWSHILKKGTALKLTDVEGGACVSLLAYNPLETTERYNQPDTLKAQYTARLTIGHCLFSDMGRVLLSVLEDSFGGHDVFGAPLSQKDLESRFGVKTYQEHRNAYYRSGRLALLTELAKYNLDDRDLVPPVNFFTRTKVDKQGALTFDTQAAKKGAYVVLQAEMDTLVVLATTQHPLDPRPEWSPRPIKLELLDSGIPPELNPAHAHSDQTRRAFINTAFYTL
jgi:urea carboxylase-associated protein 2